MTDSNIPTVTVRETVTATAAATDTAGFDQGRPMNPPHHPFPHAFGGPVPAQFPPPFIPMGGLPPAIQPGSIVSPFAAVLCILTVAGCYWAFKYLPNLNQSSSNGTSAASSNSDKDEKDKDKDKDKSSGGASDNPTGSPMVTISPAAFISLFCFALLAIVIIQGRLGMAEAFSGKDTSAQTVSSSVQWPGPQLGLRQILDLLQGQAPSSPRTPTGADPPQLGGQHHAVGPNGAASASWYINQGGAPGTPRNAQKPTGQPDLTMADRLTLAGLPIALQNVDLCRSQPATCAALLVSLDPAALAQILSPDGSGAGGTPGVGPARSDGPIAKPVPLIPQHGFMGSYQGLMSLENAFYPMLIGAIGLIVLFDYGT